jgi:YspA, cpYpsA-related SLOG family
VKVIVAGSRNIPDTSWLTVEKAVYKTDWIISEIVSGTAKGIDTYGEQYGEKRGIPVKQFPADWDNLGKRAGFIRNAEMAAYADALIAIWDGKSRGTLHMINTMVEAGKPVYVLCP